MNSFQARSANVVGVKLPPADQLLERSSFTELVGVRDRGVCVVCAEPGVDAHHLLERKLWPDGGYYLANGVLLCSDCHWKAETTDLSVEQLRTFAGIDLVMVPPGFDPDVSYTKWGDVIRSDGFRERGPLFEDTGARKALQRHLGVYLFS